MEEELAPSGAFDYLSIILSPVCGGNDNAFFYVKLEV